MKTPLFINKLVYSYIHEQVNRSQKCFNSFQLTQGNLYQLVLQ